MTGTSKLPACRSRARQASIEVELMLNIPSTLSFEAKVSKAYLPGLAGLAGSGIMEPDTMSAGSSDFAVSVGK